MRPSFPHQLLWFSPLRAIFRRSEGPVEVGARANPHGLVADYSYDSLDQLTSISLEDRTTNPTTVLRSWTYGRNADGNTSLVTEQEVSQTPAVTTYGYDDANRLTTATQAQGPRRSMLGPTSMTTRGIGRRSDCSHDVIAKVRKLEDEEDIEHLRRTAPVLEKQDEGMRSLWPVLTV